jgi:hypothetical protein
MSNETYFLDEWFFKYIKNELHMGIAMSRGAQVGYLTPKKKKKRFGQQVNK